MKPFSKIKVMDVYRNPVTGGEWLVLEKNTEEKMIAITLMARDLSMKRLIWKRNTDRVFGFPLVQEGVEL